VDKVRLYLSNYLMILKLQARSRMSFRVNFFTMLVSVFLRELVMLAMMLVLVQRFDGLAGWDMWEIAFLYSVVNFTYRNYSSFFGGISQVVNLVKNGGMDAYLLTPLSPLFLINARHTMVWRAYYNVGILIVTIYSGYMAGIMPTMWNVVVFLVMMVSAMLILFAIYLIIFSFSFYVLEISAVASVVSQLTQRYMIYPISIYGAVGTFLFTFILPLGFVAYYPSAFLLDKTQGVLFHPMLGVLTPVMAVFWLVIAGLLWRRGVRRYESTGS